jgi:branched-chain amino acid transport system permease protein
VDPSFLLVQSLSGLASASSLFVIASGLTLVFGVTRIVNFAHGSFYMLGAYIAVTVVPWLLEIDRSPWLFFAGVLASAIAVGLLGVAMEFLLLRRIYKVPELFQLLATFGVVLMVQDAVLKIWGPVDLPGPRAPGLRHGVEILGQRFPAYELFLIAVGPAVLGLLWLLMHRTRFGILIRAATATGRWWARSASIRRCCSPARCSSAPSSPGSAARCRSRASRRPGRWISRSSPRSSW